MALGLVGLLVSEQERPVVADKKNTSAFPVPAHQQAPCWQRGAFAGPPGDHPRPPRAGGDHAGGRDLQEEHCADQGESGGTDGFIPPTRALKAVTNRVRHELACRGAFFAVQERRRQEVPIQGRVQERTTYMDPLRRRTWSCTP